MRSLDEMNAKLDALKLDIQAADIRMDELAASQGIILATLNELDAKVMATGNALADEITALRGRQYVLARATWEKIGSSAGPKRKKR